jgi:surfeit locus 1 family protein
MGGMLVPGVAALAGLAVLLGLGTWQIQRKTWKEGLIATLAQRLDAAPMALPAPGEWSALTQDNWEFRRVRLRAEFRDSGDALVFTSGSTLREDVKSPGYFVFAPARLPGGGTVVVNRGYVRDRSYPRADGAVDVVGYLRWPEASSWFVSDHDAAGAIWYVRDQRLMAKVRSWGQVAPFYIEQESPVPQGGLPHPATLNVRLRNEHLQYALTWYGLALVLVVMFAIWATQRLRQRPD